MMKHRHICDYSEAAVVFVATGSSDTNVLNAFPFFK